jgi:hypothetical protein
MVSRVNLVRVHLSLQAIRRPSMSFLLVQSHKIHIAGNAKSCLLCPDSSSHEHRQGSSDISSETIAIIVHIHLKSHAVPPLAVLEVPVAIEGELRATINPSYIRAG